LATHYWGGVAFKKLVDFQSCKVREKEVTRCCFVGRGERRGYITIPRQIGTEGTLDRDRPHMLQPCWGGSTAFVECVS